MSAPYLPLNAYGSSDAGKFLAGLNLPGLIANLRGMAEEKNNQQARQLGLQLAQRKEYIAEQEAGYHGGVKPPSIAGGGDPYATAQQPVGPYGNQTQSGRGALSSVVSAPQVPMQPTSTSGGEPGMVAPAGAEPTGLRGFVGRMLGVRQMPTLAPLGPRNGLSQTEADEMLRQEIQQHQSDVDYERRLHVLGLTQDFEHGEDVYKEGQENARAAETAKRQQAQYNASEANATTRALLGSFAAAREQAAGRLSNARDQLHSIRAQKDMFGNPSASPDEVNAATSEFNAAQTQYNNNDRLLRAVVGKLRPDLVSSLDTSEPDQGGPPVASPQTDAGPSSPALRTLNAQAGAALRAAKTQAERNKIMAHYRDLISQMR